MATLAGFLGHPGWCDLIHGAHAWDGCRCSRCGAALHEWGAWEPVRTSFYDLERRRCHRDGCSVTETWVLPD